ncbi:uncharacterized protein LOC134831055 [Culicoides brevitarsis]|uniref:uncharacterized protein LOC134831055 n=1 Tax=Culicoides brevitarsis TaxID=469753 RepID=UPI00307C341A
MGIRGLDTFIKTKVKNGTRNVKVDQEIQQEKQKTGKDVLLVIDLDSMMNHCCTIDAEMLCGMRTEVYCARIDEFFQKLLIAGAKLIFFSDGPPQDDKHPTWIQRQNRKYEEQLAVIDKIEHHVPLREILAAGCPTTTLIGSVLRKKAKKYGSLHISMDNECDLELAAFATKNAAFAVLGDDSDFLIYAGEWQYWSVKQMDEEKMTTTAYNRAALRAHLALSQEQMPVFGALGGNDIVQFEDIKGFHNRIGWRDKFDNIAHYVRPLPLNFVEREEIFDKITRDVFSHRSDWQKFKSFLKSGIEIYNYNSIKSEKRTEFLQKLLENNLTDAFALFKQYPYTSTTLFQDMRDTSKKPYSQMALEIRAKMVGAMFKNVNDPNLQMKVVIKMSHEDPYRQILWKPNYPIFNVPSPEKLIFRDPNDGLDEKRKEILRWILLGSHFIPLNTDRLFSLPQELILPVATLFYLVKEGNLSIYLADILLLTVLNSANVHMDPPEYLFKDAFTASFLYLKMFQFLVKVFKVIGLRDFAPTVKFDGYLFHKLHQQNLKFCNIDVRQIENLRIFYQ